MICDLPSKILSTVAFNIPLYYMAHLRTESGHVVIYLLFAFCSTLTMSMIFRTIGQMTRTIAEALTPTALLVIGLVIYTGFIIPIRNMQGWLRWINYINPLAYSYEALVANEFHNRDFECVSFVPEGSSYENITSAERTCSVTGASSGSSVVSGDLYAQESYGYYYSHVWRFVLLFLFAVRINQTDLNSCRNFGILIAYIVFFMIMYILAAEYITADRGKGEILLFRRKHISNLEKKKQSDEESASEMGPAVIDPGADTEKGSAGEDKSVVIQEQTNILHWRNLTYDVPIKGGIRRITDHVDGWVKPGALTALMVSLVFLSSLLSLAPRLNHSTGSLGCRKDNTSRCSGQPSTNWRRRWRYPDERPSTRHLVPTSDWLRPTTRSSPRDCHSERSIDFQCSAPSA